MAKAEAEGIAPTFAERPDGRGDAGTGRACSTPSGMFDAAAGAARADRARPSPTAVTSTGLPDHDDIENVVVLGMGGSGIAGDVLPVAAGPFMPVPVSCTRATSIPNFIDEHTLVFAISFSGDTEETLEAATAAAVAGGSSGVHQPRAASSAELAGQWGVPASARGPPASPCPGPASARSAIPPMVVLEQLGLFPGATLVDRRRRRAAPAPPRPARRRGQPGRRAGPAHRAHVADHLRRGRAGRGGRPAMEDPVQRERQGRRPSPSPVPEADPQRDLRLGPARRRHPPGVAPRRRCATSSSTPRSPAASIC